MVLRFYGVVSLEAHTQQFSWSDQFLTINEPLGENVAFGTKIFPNPRGVYNTIISVYLMCCRFLQDDR
jgi:hypothetical protein